MPWPASANGHAHAHAHTGTRRDAHGHGRRGSGPAAGHWGGARLLTLERALLLILLCGFAFNLSPWSWNNCPQAHAEKQLDLRSERQLEVREGPHLDRDEHEHGHGHRSSHHESDGEKESEHEEDGRKGHRRKWKRSDGEKHKASQSKEDDRADAERAHAEKVRRAEERRHKLPNEKLVKQQEQEQRMRAQEEEDRRAALGLAPPDGADDESTDGSEWGTAKRKKLPNEKLQRQKEQQERMQAQEEEERKQGQGDRGGQDPEATGSDSKDTAADPTKLAMPLSEEEERQQGLAQTESCPVAGQQGVQPPGGQGSPESRYQQLLSKDALGPLPPLGTWPEEQRSFFAQPDGLGLQPCVQQSAAYGNESATVVKAGRFVLAVVTGGLNQLRLQIGNAVVIARIMKAALVVPVLQENAIWHDRSEFADVFDVAHFKRVLVNDVRVVTALPPRYLQTVPEEWMPPALSPPSWFAKYLRKPLKRDHVILLRGLDQSIATDLPLDLQRLRCKVEFHALRFVRPIRELAQRLVQRMTGGGTRPFLALHLRLEHDVWVRTGCSPQLGPDLDALVQRERRTRPDLLTAKMNLTADARLRAGLCPMTAAMVTWLLAGFGAPNSTAIFWAGGEPLGGSQRALAALTERFGPMAPAGSGGDAGPAGGGHGVVHTKESLALPGELEELGGNLNMLAAVDMLVCRASTVFMPSHGGNMAHVIQGHRAYFGHRKSITPNKRRVVELLAEQAQRTKQGNPMGAAELTQLLAEAHRGLMGQPRFRTVAYRRRDAVLYPAPECMCRSHLEVGGDMAHA